MSRADCGKCMILLSLTAQRHTSTQTFDKTTSVVIFNELIVICKKKH